MSLKSTNLMIVGDSGHGKDTFAEALGIPYGSSSKVALDIYVWDQWGKDRYLTKEECWKDRRNHMQIWSDLIEELNREDPKNLGRAIYAKNSIYVGCRKLREFNALRDAGYFDLSICVIAGLRLGFNLEDPNEILPRDCDIVIANDGTEEEFLAKIDRFKRAFS